MYKVQCCKQCRHVKFKGNMTKCPVPKPTNRTAQKIRRTQRRNSHLDKQPDFVFIGFCYF